MQELLEKTVKQFVDNPDEVKVTQTESEDGLVLLSLSVNPADMGKVIGKGGKIAKSLRLMLRVPAIREHKRVNLEIIDSATAAT